MPYLKLLRRPHVGRLLSGSLVGRLPTAMAALAIALALRAAGADYRLVGAAGGVYAVSGAIGGPLLGRWVDRLGQPRVLVVSSLVSAAGFAALAAAPGSTAVAVLGPAVAGAASPPLEPCLRALWPDLVEPDELESAYAVDAGAQELVFIGGPLLVGGLAVAGPPRLALLAAAVLGVVGALSVATSAPSRAWASAARSVHWLGPLRSRALVVLLCALTGCGWALGTFNVFAVAYAERHPLPGGAGTLLALNSTGALIGALLIAALPWRADAATKAAVSGAGMALTFWPFTLVPGPPAMALVALLSGVFFAPLLTVVFRLTGELAPAGTVTEAFAWLVTLVTTGIAGGSAVSGLILADGSLPAAAVSAASGVTLSALTLTATRPLLARDTAAVQPAGGA
ncbi:MFS transporter [Streptomyces sp. NPDC008238]